jgi:hypothetical protein
VVVEMASGKVCSCMIIEARGYIVTH